MRAWCKAGLALGVTVAVSMMLRTPLAVAHEHETAGDLELTFGWHTEPAFTGAANALDLEVDDATGAPVSGAGSSLAIEVSIGDSRTQLELAPSDEPGLFTAPIIPTRAGTYGVHITGTVAGQAIDLSSTCSEQTFDCVQDPTAVQFPTKDPAPGQVAERLDREAARTDAARSSSSSAHTLAIVAIAVSVLALTAVLVVGIEARRSRKHA